MGTSQLQISLVLTAIIAAGCSNDLNQNKGVPPHEQQIISASDREFEKSKDPPLNATSHFAAGQLAESQGNLTKAVEQYTQALKLDGKNKQALYRLAVVQTQLQQYPEAVKIWKRYIDVTNNSAAGYSNLGYTYEIAGQQSEAEAAYQKGIEIEPDNAPCRINYGLMLARRGQIEAAQSQLSMVLPPAQVQYNLGSVSESKGDRLSAAKFYRRALELDPTLSAARTRLAAVE
ncbi:MAG: tetratricopeptide repeat protein [Phycisphaerales bacterium]|nr:tetratricopeptide repeat protein [Phycisphaerales bacterium]